MSKYDMKSAAILQQLLLLNMHVQSLIIYPSLSCVATNRTSFYGVVDWDMPFITTSACTWIFQPPALQNDHIFSLKIIFYDVSKGGRVISASINKTILPDGSIYQTRRHISTTNNVPCGLYVKNPSENETSCPTGISMESVCSNRTRTSSFWPPRISSTFKQFRMTVQYEFLPCPTSPVLQDDSLMPPPTDTTNTFALASIVVVLCIILCMVLYRCRMNALELEKLRDCSSCAHKKVTRTTNVRKLDTSVQGSLEVSEGFPSYLPMKGTDAIHDYTEIDLGVPLSAAKTLPVFAQPGCLPANVTKVERSSTSNAVYEYVRPNTAVHLMQPTNVADLGNDGYVVARSRLKATYVDFH